MNFNFLLPSSFSAISYDMIKKDNVIQTLNEGALQEGKKGVKEKLKEQANNSTGNGNIWEKPG